MTVRELMLMLSALPPEVQDLPVAVRDGDDSVPGYNLDPEPCVARILRTWCYPTPAGEGEYADVFLI